MALDQGKLKDIDDVFITNIESASLKKKSGLDGHSSTTAHEVDKSPISREQMEHELTYLRKLHRWDPNLSSEVADGLLAIGKEYDVAAELDLITMLESDSPYPEVRAAVRNFDEDMPASTIRAWVIGMFMVMVGSSLNMIFSLRSPSMALTSFVAQLVAYPIGRGWDLVMPKRSLKLFGRTFHLVPGPFNMKEHTLIVVMANVTFNGGTAYSTDIIVALRGFYKRDLGMAWNILVTLATQMIGYGFAGVFRRFLVWPASMIWPINFVNTSLFYALHDHSPTDPARANGWSIGRYRYFLYVLIGSFVWAWFPGKSSASACLVSAALLIQIGWIFPALSMFSFITWIKPDHVVINQLFGYTTGLGLLPITFDWMQISGYTMSPLMFPWHAIGNTLLGMVFFFIILTCSLQYSNWNWSNYLPISDSAVYDNTGMAPYNISMVLDANFQFDEAGYHAYSPLFLPTTFAVAYGLSFASVTALITHTALFHGQEIWMRSRLALGGESDIHSRLMRKYAEVPSWWYLTLFLVTLCFAFASVLGFDTALPWWAFALALFISFVFCVPVGTVQAVTNVQVGLNTVTEFIVGYILPGRPLAMMLFKTYGYITMTQALAFSQDLKLGHYMKVPPRAMFWAQVIASVWAAFIQVGVLQWAFANIPNVCERVDGNNYNCPSGRTFFNASIIWGVVGPSRIFSPGQIYDGLLYFFLAGAVAPLVLYVLARIFPRSPLRFVNLPLVFGGPGQIPPASTLNYSTWGIVGFIFNKWFKDRYRGWWANYNYLTSAALDVGLALASIVIFFSLQMTNTSFPLWWGNTVFTKTLDYNYQAVQSVVSSDMPTFGPATW